MKIWSLATLCCYLGTETYNSLNLIIVETRAKRRKDFNF